MNKIKAYPYSKADFDDFLCSTQDEYVCRISAEDFYNKLENDGIFYDFTSHFDLTVNVEEINMFGTITCYVYNEEEDDIKVFMEFELTLYDCRLTITKTE